MYRLKTKLRNVAINLFNWVASQKYIYYRFCQLYDDSIISGLILVTPKNINGIYNVYAKSHIASRLLLSEYEQETINILNKLKNTDGTIVNIGANIGLISIHIGLTYQKYDKIIAIEPNKEALELLKLNIKQNKLENKIETVMACISDSHGTIELFSTPGMPEYSSMGSKIIHPAVEMVNQISYSVEMLKLEDLKLSNVSFLIIDTEGAEYLVLKGSQSILEKNHPAILFECEDRLLEKFGNSTKEIIDFLSGIGYVLYDAEKGKKLKFNKKFRGEILAIYPDSNIDPSKIFN